jgi:hypothetical protein
MRGIQGLLVPMVWLKSRNGRPFIQHGTLSGCGVGVEDGIGNGNGNDIGDGDGTGNGLAHSMATTMAPCAR